MTMHDEWTTTNGHTPAPTVTTTDLDPATRLDQLDPADLDRLGATLPWGDEPHQRVSTVIAAGMMRLLRERDAILWAELHYQAATGETIELGTTARRKRQAR